MARELADVVGARRLVTARSPAQRPSIALLTRHFLRRFLENDLDLAGGRPVAAAGGGRRAARLADAVHQRRSCRSATSAACWTPGPGGGRVAERQVLLPRAVDDRHARWWPWRSGTALVDRPSRRGDSRAAAGPAGDDPAREADGGRDSRRRRRSCRQRVAELRVPVAAGRSAFRRCAPRRCCALMATHAVITVAAAASAISSSSRCAKRWPRFWAALVCGRVAVAAGRAHRVARQLAAADAAGVRAHRPSAASTTGGRCRRRCGFSASTKSIGRRRHRRSAAQRDDGAQGGERSRD